MGDSMSTIINATTTNGVVIQPDNSGSLVLQTNSGTTALTIDTSQRAAFVAGTAALPAITTTGDTNTGIFFPAADTIAFAEGGTESMRIDSSGNVKIGTTATTYDYQTKNLVLADASTAGISITNTTQTLTLTANSAGGYVGTRSNHSLQFTTNDIERMRIDSSGNVLVGTTAAPSASQSGVKICNPLVAYSAFSAGNNNGEYYQIGFLNGNGLIGRISTNGSATSYVTSSDYRLKNNIVPMIGALDKVAQLKPVTYTWIADGSSGQGFIAHELQAIIPECVSGEKDAVDEEGNIKPQGVDTSFLVATLTAAIKEQQTIINDLKARVETLEAK
jgi:hypothetical protein